MNERKRLIVSDTIFEDDSVLNMSYKDSKLNMTYKVSKQILWKDDDLSD